jgi:hypothetical protein
MAAADAPLATWWRASRDHHMAAADDWRCAVPARWLPGARRWLADLQMFSWPDALERMVEAQVGTAAIFAIPASRPEAELIAALRDRGVRVLIESDEPVLDGSQPFVVVSDGQEGIGRELQAQMRDLHRQCVEEADGLVVSTERVANSYAHVGKPTFVCPSSVDPADWPKPQKPDDGIFRVGFAGSALFRIADLELAHAALSWAATQPGVEVVLMGADPTSQPTPEEGIELGELDRRAAHGRAKEIRAAIAERQAKWRFPHRFIPTAPLAEYRRNLAQLDVGLCPVDVSAHEWAECGSDSKALDYAMSAVLPVCADAEPYRGWKWPLVDGAQGFLDRVAWCVENRETVREHGRQWREAVLRERTIEANIGAWRDACGVGASKALVAA